MAPNRRIELFLEAHFLAPTPPQRRLRIDTNRQQLQLDGQPPLSVRGRFDLPFLAVLAAGGHHSARQSAGPSRVIAGLQSMGLPAHALTAKSWHRILDRLHEALRALDPSAHLPAVQHAARSKTTGPWWLVMPDGLAVEVHPSLPPANHPAQAGGPPRLAQRLLDHDAVRLTGALKRATEFAWNGLLTDAVTAFSDNAAWLGESAELRSLRLLRCADVEITLGRHLAARHRLALAAAAVHGKAGEELMRPHLQAVLLRCDYAQNPQQHYARVAQALRPLAQAWSNAPAEVDAASLGERLNLLCLCERRAAECGPRGSDDDSTDARMTRLLEAAHGALFCYLLVQNHEKAQYVCANLAYAHQRIAAKGSPVDWRLAVEWHALSFGFSEGFQQSENSAWEFIYLGELWLASAEARAAFHRAELRAAWRNYDPSTLDFYVAACALADSLNDPRQQAYAWLNRYRFAKHLRLRVEREAARVVLATHLAQHPLIRQLIVEEGYQLPELDRKPPGAATASLNAT